MRNKILSILLISFILLSLNACKKNDTSPKDFRVTNSIITLFSPINNTYEWNITYENNHLKTVQINNTARNEYSYSGDSIIVSYYWFENDKWGLLSAEIQKFNNNRIVFNYTIDSLENKLVETYYTYAGENIKDILGYKTEGDSTYLYDSYIYTYENNKLIQGSFSYKAFPEQDIIENIRHELKYSDGKLYEEFIYRDFNGYPIQLSNKKIYKYDNMRVVLVENYEYENNEFIHSTNESREYDNHGNLIKKIESKLSGELVSEQTFTYEEGKYTYQYLYNIIIGSEGKYPIP